MHKQCVCRCRGLCAGFLFAAQPTNKMPSPAFFFLAPWLSTTAALSHHPTHPHKHNHSHPDNPALIGSKVALPDGTEKQCTFEEDFAMTILALQFQGLEIVGSSGETAHGSCTVDARVRFRRVVSSADRLTVLVVWHQSTTAWCFFDVRRCCCWWPKSLATMGVPPGAIDTARKLHTHFVSGFHTR